MQDRSTGEMVSIPDLSAESKDRALPRDRQGPTFYIGEHLELKGGRFAVSSIGPKALILRGLPGTRAEISETRWEALARLAWETYSASVGGLALNGDRLPDWNTMKHDPAKRPIVNAWRNTALKLYEAVV